MPVISYENEVRIAKTLFKACGIPEEGAEYSANVIAHSDFIGRYSHGLSRLAFFMNMFDKGVIKLDPEYKVLREDKTTIAIDCDNGFGLLSAKYLYDKVMPKAKEYGIAMGTVKKGANIGCASYYGWSAVEEDMICLMVSNSYLSMSPFGGADRLMGTNPIMIAIPAGEEDPVCLDIATSQVAMGKIHAFAREGKELAPGWAKDADGNPTTDAKAAFTVVPFGGHKGYGLAVMVDIFSAVLSGAAYCDDLGKPEKLEVENLGFSMCIIDPSKFMDIDEFKARVDDYSRRIKNSRKSEGVAEIFMPGEIECRTFKKTMETGYEISDALAAQLCADAVRLGLMKEGEGFDKLLEISGATA